MSLSTVDILESLRPGDVIQAQAVFEVVSAGGAKNVLVKEHGGEGISATGMLFPTPTLKVQVIKRAASWREIKDGSKVSGAELRAIQWKRGTIVKHADKRTAGGYVLLGDGTWADLDAPANDSIRFDFQDFTSTEGYTVVHLGK